MARILPGVGNLYKEARTATGAAAVFDERKPYINETREAIERAWAQPQVVGKMLDIAAGTGKTFYDKYNRVQEAKTQVIAQRRKTGQTQKPDPTGMFSIGGVTPQELQAAGVNTMQQAAADAAGAKTYGEREAAMRMAERAYDRPGTYSFVDEMVGGPDTRRRELIKKLYPPLHKPRAGGGAGGKLESLNFERDPKGELRKNLLARRDELVKRKAYRESPGTSGQAFFLSSENLGDVFDKFNMKNVAGEWIYGDAALHQEILNKMTTEPLVAQRLAEDALRRTLEIKQAAEADKKELASAQRQEAFYNQHLEPFFALGSMRVPPQHLLRYQRGFKVGRQILAESVERGIDPEQHPNFPEFYALTREFQLVQPVQETGESKGPRSEAAQRLESDMKKNAGKPGEEAEVSDRELSKLQEMLSSGQTESKAKKKDDIKQILDGVF
mgnify:CR=1 FL=1